MKAKHYKDKAIKYADDVIAGKIIASDDIINACKRFKKDLKRKDLEFRTTEADAAVSIMEGMFVHRKGEALDGTPLLGKPFILEPFQIFAVLGNLHIGIDPDGGFASRRGSVEDDAIQVYFVPCETVGRFIVIGSGVP